MRNMAYGEDSYFREEERSNSNSYVIIIPYLMKTNQLLNLFGNRSESAVPFLDSQEETHTSAFELMG